MPMAKDLLPTPFDWCEIPAGMVKLGRGYTSKTYGVGQRFDVSAFLMSKYPITNAQYAKFIDAGAYKNKHWWTEDGWKAKEEGLEYDYSNLEFKATGKSWSEPLGWKDSQWNHVEQPVVGVSWYESLAFCLWLSETSSEKIMLPTEQQWQRAAQGDDGWVYPWGNDWDANCCNNNVDKKGIRKSVPVRQYEGKGDSPFKVVDMAGNVGEWCLEKDETGSIGYDGTEARVLRGGSWLNINTVNFRVDNRYMDYPYYRNRAIGFRIASWFD